MGEEFDFTDAGGTVLESRGISAPGATPDDVLTVGADGTVSAQPSGGSQPLRVLDPVTILYNTPNLYTTGIPLGTILEGEVIAICAVETITPFDVSGSAMWTADSAAGEALNNGNPGFSDSPTEGAKLRQMNWITDNGQLAKADYEAWVTVNNDGPNAQGEVIIRLVAIAIA